MNCHKENCGREEDHPIHFTKSANPDVRKVAHEFVAPRQSSLLEEARGLLIRAKNAAHKLEMNKLEREIDDFLERTK